MSYLLKAAANKGKLDNSPGDFVVDRAMRTVYVIAPDGSRRRIDDHDAKSKVIAKLKEFLKCEPSSC